MNIITTNLRFIYLCHFVLHQTRGELLSLVIVFLSLAPWRMSFNRAPRLLELRGSTVLTFGGTDLLTGGGGGGEKLCMLGGLIVGLAAFGDIAELDRLPFIL